MSIPAVGEAPKTGSDRLDGMGCAFFSIYSGFC